MSCNRGGGDSRGFVRAPWRSTTVTWMRKAGRLRVLLNSNVKSIDVRTVDIEHDGGGHPYRNEAVLVCAGGLLPTPLLQKVGIRFDTKFRSV